MMLGRPASTEPTVGRVLFAQGCALGLDHFLGPPSFSEPCLSVGRNAGQAREE